MKTMFRIGILGFVCIVLSACCPLRTGLVDGVLTTNQRPAIGIAVNAPYAVIDSGRIWTQPKTDVMIDVANASFDYAIYADQPLASATSMAWAAIVRLQDPDRWAFEPRRPEPRGGFGAVRTESEVRNGSVRNVCVTSEGEWASEVVAANGGQTPQRWLARRWVFHLEDDVRAVAEYREPWPEGLDAPGGDIWLVRDQDAEYIRDFERRAAQVFVFTPGPGSPMAEPVALSRLVMPRVLPDVADLAGDIRNLENAGSETAYD